MFCCLDYFSNSRILYLVKEGCLDQAAYEKYKKEKGGEERIDAMVFLGTSHYDHRWLFVLQNSHKGGFLKSVEA
jgi:hypothetical protein